ncbi:MAG TPA: helix-turn-helix domain-containing protein [Steroidobacteraceae bacterium]|jgi:AraC-like DNA-binding protein|nr:helix-turn-helix domain-containing protein [Steroidobacteraceae bacterium]
MDQLSIAVAGFSAVSAVLLFLAYAFFIDVPGKSAISVCTCGALLGALLAIQLGHFQYFLGAPAPLDRPWYRGGLFIAPSSFYFFGRWAILPMERFRAASLLHLAPVLLLFVPRREIAMPVLFTFGAGYSIWLAYLVWGLRQSRKQFRFEFLYFVVMTVLAITVLALGFSIPFVGDVPFYYFYNSAIALGIAIMVVALVANPNLLGDLTEVARARYGTSTLGEVDVAAALEKLRLLMTDGKAYQNESLSLASLAAELGLSTHQLSELINTRLGMGFSRYVRDRRVEAAKRLLIAAPAQSILSVSLDTGFRSQSAFYAAFKELTGQSPGDFRESGLRNDQSAIGK